MQEFIAWIAAGGLFQLIVQIGGGIAVAIFLISLVLSLIRGE